MKLANPPGHIGSRLFVLLVSLTFVCAGCSTENNSNNAVKPDNADNTTPDDTTPDDTTTVDAVSLRESDAKTFEEVLTASRGKVVLVDFWATWCVPCKKNFPKIVKYGRKYGADGLVIVSVSIDDAETHEDVLAFLRSVKATGTNLRSQWGAGTKSAEQFDFSGEVPFYKLYDRSGKLRYQFSANADITAGVEPLEQIEPRLKELLGK